MRLTTRSKTALALAGYVLEETSAIAQLVAFAAQNSGIDPRNYYDPHDRICGRMQTYRDGVKAFNDERRSISRDWSRFKEALHTAAIEGVTDADVIAEAPHAFSGRLEWKHAHRSIDANGKTYPAESHWDYCTGQYFPTEYRAAAATLLEAATRRVRQARPPEARRITTISELKVLNEKNGGCWFEPSTMRYFRTRIESPILHGRYFISSEQQSEESRRKFTVRSFDEFGSVDTVGEFHSHNTKAEAMAALKAEISRQEVAA